MLALNTWVVVAAIVAIILLLVLLAIWLWNSWNTEASRLEKEVAAQFGMTVDELYEHWATSATFEQTYNTWLRAQRGPISYLQEIK